MTFGLIQKNEMHKSIRNIGILAHVDAGKTTITEQLLFTAGAIRSVGSVDKGTAVTDNLLVERERGISVRSSTASFVYKETLINIIDTPGHVDFCAEVERSIKALDAVVLVISAVEGVQGHTLSLFDAIKHMNLPCVIFINKIDRIGADVDRVMQEIERDLCGYCILLQQPVNQGCSDANIINTWQENNINNKELTEKIIENNDDLLEMYLSDQSLDFSLLDKGLKKAIIKCILIPVVIGVAKEAIGIDELLDVIINYLPKAKGNINNPLSSVVFKIEHDKTMGKMCYIRVFEGMIKPRDLLTNAKSKNTTNQKVSQLKTVVKGKYVTIDNISAGEIGIISGLSFARVGDVYGEIKVVPTGYRLSTVILTVQVKPIINTQIMDLVQALKQLVDEDPLLDLQWLPDLRELHIKITGLIQIEIIQSVLKERFNIDADFSKPSIIYKETPSKPAFGYERYWMPKPCWAILKLKIEPAKQGSGVSYSSLVSVNKIAGKYQNEIEQTILVALKQGLKGWQVTDLKITLVDGEDHNVHSRSGDFIIATPMAIMNGLVETGTTLLEPILSFNISASIDLLGSITSDIIKMRGAFNPAVINKTNFSMTGKVPAATSLDYPTKLAALSAGKAKFNAKLSGYKACFDKQGEIAEYRGINPLDRDKWILLARGALGST